MSQRSDLIVHPVRSRILVLLMGRRLLTQEIAAMLPDVPKPSLYRHLQKMVEGGVLRVVEERPVRGAAEKLFEVAEGAGEIPREELNTKAGRQKAFATFIGVLTARFRALLEHERFDPERDGIGSMALPVWLSRSDLPEFNAGLLTYIRGWEREPTPDRGRVVVSLISFPDEPLP